MAKVYSTVDSANSELAAMYQSKEYQQLSEKVKAEVRASSQPGPFGLRTKLVWKNVSLVIVMHVVCAFGVVTATQAKWQSYVCYVILSTCTVLGVSAGVHRLWSHRSYKAKLPYRIVLMCFNCLAWQGSIHWWARNHRLHHKYSDTDADPHNPKRGFFFSHIGWTIMRLLPQVLIKRESIDMSDLKQDPVVTFQKRYYQALCLLLTVIMPTFLPWYFWNENLLVSFFFLFGFRYVTCTHCILCINSVGHRWGNRPYNKDSCPADNHFLCFTSLGEGYHNYHHAFPFDYAAGEWGPKLNLTTCFIDLCAALGLVYDRKQVSQESILKIRQRKGDLSD